MDGDVVENNNICGDVVNNHVETHIEAIEVKVKKLHEDAQLPVFAHDGDACADLYSAGDYFIPAGCRQLALTGIAIQLPKNWEAQIRPRSGLALHFGLTVLNSPGTIDSGYRGEIGVIIHNAGGDCSIKKGDRIAQIAVRGYGRVSFVVDELSGTERGAGGFGSTGR